MKVFFRYDYNYKLTIINFVLCILCLAISAFVFYTTIAFVILMIAAFLLSLNSIFMYNHGIHISYAKNKIWILDELLIRKLDFKNVRYISYKIIEKEKGNNFKGLISEFYHPHTYMTNCEHTYNEGLVLKIIFHLNDGTTIESYYGWMYREKKKSIVEKQIDRLDKIIEFYNKKSKSSFHSLKSRND